MKKFVRGKGKREGNGMSVEVHMEESVENKRRQMAYF